MRDRCPASTMPTWTASFSPARTTGRIFCATSVTAIPRKYASAWRASRSRPSVKSSEASALSQQVRAQLGDRSDAQLPQHPVELGQQYVERQTHPPLSAGRQAVEGRAGDHYGVGPQRQGLDDVRASAEAAVHDDGHAIANGIDDLRQHLDGGNAA